MRIEEILLERSMTKAELANLMGISKQLLYTYMKRDMHISTAEKFAKALDIPMWELFISREQIMEDLNFVPRKFVCPKCGEIMDFSDE